MQEKRKLSIWWKLLIAASVLVVLVVTGNAIIKSVVEKKIRTSANQFAPYVKTNIAAIHVNLLSASINFDSINIQFQPNQKIENKHELFFNEASISGINFFKLIGGKNFSASLFKINDGKINLDKDLLKRNDSLPSSLFSALKIPFHNLSLGKIEINNANVFQGDSTDQKKLLNANFVLNNVEIKNLDSSFSKNNFHFSDLNCELTKINYNLPGYHVLSIKRITLNSKDSSLKIDSIKIVPQLNKYEIGEKVGHQVDYIKATIPSVEVSGLHIEKLMEQKFYASTLNIKKSNFYFFRDRRLTRQLKNQPTPLDYLKKIPVDVYIDHFNFKNCSATSEEFPKDGPAEGHITMDDVSISASPFFNHPQKNNSSITSHVKGSIMDAGTIEASIKLSLITGDQDIHGSIHELQLPAMNPSAVNLGKFKVESGVLNQLDFDFTATDKKATGTIVGVYHDLVVNRLKFKDGKLKEAKMASFALHHIIIPKNKDESMNVKRRTGKIDYDRDPTRMVTFYLIKSLLDGIRDSFALGFVLPK